MKFHHVAVLALLLAGCVPDLAAIDAANDRAESAATRAEASAEIASRAATKASDSSIRVLNLAEAAEQSFKRANDAVSRMEGSFDPAAIIGTGRPRHHRRKPI